jgi:hypothetical protein
MSIVQRFATPEPTGCAVCHRQAGNWGYAARSHGAPLIWLCDDPNCLRLGRRVYTMPAKQLDTIEILARNDAGDAGGAYLDELGIAETTPLADLPQEVWYEFLNRIVRGFEENLRKRLLDHTAPF